MTAPRVGVWRAIGRLHKLSVGELLWPEGVSGLLIGAGGAVWIMQGTSVSDRLDVMGDVLALAGALLAVVFTALALVVSIPSNAYIRKMAETRDGGMLRFLDPFLIAVGTQAAVVVLAFAYNLAAEHVPAAVEHGAFYVVGFLVVFGLLDVVALARSLVRHGLNRATEALAAKDEETGGAVRRLPERRQQ